MYNSKYYDSDVITRGSGGYRPSQPSQRYPFRAIRPPRVDNQNQPWYSSAPQSRWWGAASGDTDGYQDSFVSDDATNAPDSYSATDAGGEPTQNLAAVWSSLNSTYGGTNPKSNLMDQSSVTGIQDGTNPVASFGADNGSAPVPPTTTKPNFWASVAAFFNSFNNSARPPSPAPSVDYSTGG